MTSDTLYDGPASIVTSGGDSFATCRLVAHKADAGWSGELSEILWRTQMVPVPLRPEERLRIDGLDDKPVLAITVVGEDGGSASIRADDDVFSAPVEG